MKNYCIRLSVCLLGTLLISLSAAIFYLTRLGSDPYQVLMVGLGNTFQISCGNANNISNGIIFVLLCLFHRKYVKPAMFLSTLLSGVFIDAFVFLIGRFVQPDSPIALKVLLTTVGCLLLAFGVYVYLLPELGASPADSIGLTISDFIKVPYKRVRIGTDVLYAAAGFAFGGSFGITTVLAVMLTGPLIGLFGKLLGESGTVTKIRTLSAAKAK